MEKEFVLKKRPLGVEDIEFDIFGDGEQKVYTLDNGSTITVRALNASHIPLTGDTRRELHSFNIDDALIALLKIAGSSSNISMTEDKYITFSTTDGVANMQRLIDGCERNLGGHTLTVTFPAKQMQTFNDTLVWKNFYNGKIIVQGTGQNDKITVTDAVNNAGALFAFDNCNCDITVQYFNFIHKYNTYAITCNASTGINLDYCHFEGNGGNAQSVLLKSGGLCYYTNCTFYNDKEPNPQSDIITVKNTYLPLSGGTMTGSLTVNNTLTVSGGVSINNTLTVSGNLTVGGKNAVRSVNGKTADTSGNASIAITDIPDLQSTLDSKLALAGGNMTGTIYNTNTLALASKTEDSYISFCGASTFNNGGTVVVYGKNHATNPGYVILGAKDGSKAQYFHLRPDGVATWCGQNICRSVNGVNADASGNVVIAISNISGLSAELTNIYNTNVTQNDKLAGKTGYPNYSAGTSTTASTYTANADGWVVVSKQQSGSYLRVKVNGGVVIDGGGSDSDRTSGMFPVKAGDTVTIFSTAQDGKTETATSATIYFYLNR